MAERLKDMFFTKQYFSDLSEEIKQYYPAFDSGKLFHRLLDENWDDRELKERMRHATEALHTVLPDDYPTALEILRNSTGGVSEYSFDNMIFSDYIGQYGLDDWNLSISALEEFTMLVSAEFAVRNFILKDQDRMMAKMLEWSLHDHEQVRRLSSEGCRPRLPWGVGLPPLKKDPAPILPILDRLKKDESETVRRSVANNLNDISKDHPRVVVSLLQNWSAIDTPEMDQLINHALRTLVKQGNQEALNLLGYHQNIEIKVKGLKIEPARIIIGDKGSFSFEIESGGEDPQKLMIDYILHFVRARGKTSMKVFKITKKTINPGESVSIKRQISFQKITTRRYYPGRHILEVQINGQIYTKGEFDLIE